MIESVLVKAGAWGKGRDAGKVYQLTEWPAARAEDWAFRMIIAYNRGGGDVDISSALGRGMEFIFWVGVQTFLRGQIQGDEIIPLFNQLLECVQIVRDPDARHKDTGDVVATPIVSDDDVAEVQTRLWLRSEVFRLHTGFSPADAASALLAAMMRPLPEGSLTT